MCAEPAGQVPEESTLQHRVHNILWIEEKVVPRPRCQGQLTGLPGHLVLIWNGLLSVWRRIFLNEAIRIELQSFCLLACDRVQVLCQVSSAEIVEIAQGGYQQQAVVIRPETLLVYLCDWSFHPNRRSAKVMNDFLHCRLGPRAREKVNINLWGFEEEGEVRLSQRAKEGHVSEKSITIDKTDRQLQPRCL